MKFKRHVSRSVIVQRGVLEKMWHPIYKIQREQDSYLVQLGISLSAIGEFTKGNFEEDKVEERKDMTESIAWPKSKRN